MEGPLFSSDFDAGTNILYYPVARWTGHGAVPELIGVDIADPKVVYNASLAGTEFGLFGINLYQPN
jgi:hypothetical protein